MSMIGIRTYFVVAAGVAATHSLAQESNAVAQDSGTVGGLQEITVTAERRESDLQRTPLAITALSSSDVERTGRTTVDTVLQNVPGVQVQTSAQSGGLGGPVNIAIRGLGTDGGNKAAATSMYVDGVIVDSMGLQFYDLQRVEILRGPQGTLYGGVATAGAVNVITNDPDLSGYKGNVRLVVGDYGLVQATGVLNAPLSETLGLRLGVNSYRREVYSDANATIPNELNARAKLLLKPNEDFSLLLGAELYQLSGGGGDGVQATDLQGNLVGPWVASLGGGSTKAPKFYATLDWNLGFASLTSITALQTYRSTQVTANTLNNSSMLWDTKHRDTTTQEFRLSNKADSWLTWVGGLYYRKYELDTSFFTGARGELPVTTAPASSNLLFYGPAHFDDESYAAFAQATLPITESLRFTGGIRYSNDDKDDFNGVIFANPANSPLIDSPVKVSYNSTDWLARLETDISDRNLMYAMVSTGYRPGGASNPRTSFASPVAQFGEENVTAYEIGSKNRFFNDRVQVNLSFFYNDYPGFQNTLTFFSTTPSGTILLPSIVGVGAEFYGSEVETAWLLGPATTLELAYAYLHAEFSEDAVTFNPLTNAEVSLATTGQIVPHAPEHQVSARLAHTFTFSTGSLVGDVTAKYQTDQATNFDTCLYNALACNNTSYARFIQDAYALVDATLTYGTADDRFSISVYGRNLSDEDIKLGVSRGFATRAAPRNFGVAFALNF